jgi:D-arabinose 1-dehydrogenase-like Zn-dependent alcohol dehydrogenase
MAKMRAVQVSRPNGPLELVERDVPDPAPGHVRIKVDACGICHSDTLTKDGTFPGVQYPRVPGHGVVGSIDAVGPGVVAWKPGERVGVGWHGGQCGLPLPAGAATSSRETETRITGITADGGYAEYVVARTEAVARPRGAAGRGRAACVPASRPSQPPNSGARRRLAVSARGLGHLGVQFAAKMGYRV